MTEHVKWEQSMCSSSSKHDEWWVDVVFLIRWICHVFISRKLFFLNSVFFWHNPLFLSYFLYTKVVGGSGGEVVPAGGVSLPEGEAASLRLCGRLDHRHHRKEASAASESDGAAAGGKLQVGPIPNHALHTTPPSVATLAAQRGSLLSDGGSTYSGKLWDKLPSLRQKQKRP